MVDISLLCHSGEQKDSFVITEIYQYDTPAIGLISSPPLDNEIFTAWNSAGALLTLDCVTALTVHLICHGSKSLLIGLERYGLRSTNDGRAYGNGGFPNYCFFGNIEDD